ncbi:MAG: HAMP domain-containing protein [Chlorobiaceae bacterium]|nr:HAMP domain-containing protein [Chlorobiaceae bacterium]
MASKNTVKKSFSFFKDWSVMSVRNRIAFYYTIATAFLIAIVFAIIYIMVERIVYKQFDQEIKKEIAEILSDSNVSTHDFKGFASLQNVDIDGGNSDNDNDSDSDNDSKKKKMINVDTEFIQLVNSTGQVINKSTSLSWCVLAFNPNQSGTSFFNSNFGGTMVRQAQVPLVNKKGITEGYLIVALPLKNAMIVLRDLEDIFFFSFPVIILTLFILTRLIAGKSIRPIEKVIATAEKITQTNLEHRIPLPDHHDELYRLSATMNGLFDRMQDAFQREKQFTANASHELKTPLAVVKGTLEVLVRKPREREHYETRIQFCLKELNRMAKLIDQLLMLARHESNKINPQIETVRLSPYIERVIERMQLSANAKNISIAVVHTENARIAVDPGMLDMIFENILSNAIKYSPAGSTIAVDINRNADAIVCSISDQGIGIPEEKLHAIFERFYRVDESRNTDTGGFGLGLSIVKKLADLQHIKVSVTSETNRGTTFSLTFPAGETNG